MNPFRHGGSRWFLAYAMPSVVLAWLVSLRALGTIEYSDSVQVAMAAVGSTTLLLVAAVHYVVVYRGVTATHS